MTTAWISVEERLPEKYTKLLVHGPSFDWAIMKLADSVTQGEKSWTDGYFWFSFCTVTHWMELPDPPKV
jgi:hypothetical protein